MIATRHDRLLFVFALLLATPTLKAEDSSNEKLPPVVELKDLRIVHDGKEVTMTLKITDTQLIAGEREGQFPHVKLHYEGMKEAPFLVVYAKGELADLLHRFAYVSPDDKFVGRSIKASGRIKLYKDFPKDVDQTPVYILELREWKKFQILPEGKEQ